jgi:adenylate cyclase
MTQANAPAVVIVEPDTEDERAVPVMDRLVVGRECSGIEEHRRLLVMDDTVSRHHFEIRLDLTEDRAVLVDLSTNGTRINGVRVERAIPIPLRTGDRILVGATHLEFRSTRFLSGGATDRGRTSRFVSTPSMALVVGDIIGYSTISEHADSSVVLDALEGLWEGLRSLLVQHQGTLNAYAGDALFAVWDADPPAEGPALAVAFARAANRYVHQRAPELALRNVDGSPVQMGWAVVLGPVAVSTLTQAQPAVIGDTTNLAFRLSGVAGRDGLPAVLVTDAVRDALVDTYTYDGPVTVQVKGRTAPADVYGIVE